MSLFLFIFPLIYFRVRQRKLQDITADFKQRVWAACEHDFWWIACNAAVINYPTTL